MATRLKYQPPGVHFAVFFGLAVGMFILNMSVTQAFFGDVANALTSKQAISPEMVTRFKWLQLIGALMTFVLPPIIYSRLASEQPWQHVGVKKNVLVIPAIITVLLLVSVQPLAMLLGELNSKAHFGAAHELVKSTEELYERVMANFLVMDTPSAFLINVVVIAMLPAIGEELFFRGCLQNILERWTRSPVVSIGLSSLGFALLHGTFLKFLPILILGVTLGTLFYVTRNLWYCILFHFLNNFLALLATYYAQRNDFMKQLAQDEVKLSWWMGLASLVVTVGLFLLMRRRIPYQPLEKPPHDPISPYNNFPTTPR